MLKLFSNIIDSIAKYFSSIDKTTLIHSIEIKNNFDNEVTRQLKDLESYLKQNKNFVSEEAETLLGKLTAELGLVKGDIKSLSRFVTNYLRKTDRVCMGLIDIINKDLPERIDPDDMTPKTAAVFELVVSLHNATMFLFEYLDTIVAIEIIAVGNKPYKHRALKWLAQDLRPNCRFMLTFDTNSSKIIDNIKELPDVEVSNEAILDFLLSKKLSNPKLKPINETLSKGTSRFTATVYRIGMIFADIKLKYYEFLKERKRLAELRLLELKEMRDGDNPNPKLEKQIQYYEELVDDLERRIRRMEPEDDED